MPQLEASMIANETEKRTKLKEIEQLEHDISIQTPIFKQSLESFKSLLDEWKRKYILQAAIAGKIAWIQQLQENQNLIAEKILGYINPEDNHYYVETYLPQVNFGKMDTTLKVQLRFDAYPYQEMGFVEGTISYISNVPTDSGFLANIRLDKGLITNTKKVISYKSGLKAQAIIITKNMRLLERLYFNIIKQTSTGK